MALPPTSPMSAPPAVTLALLMPRSPSVAVRARSPSARTEASLSVISPLAFRSRSLPAVRVAPLVTLRSPLPAAASRSPLTASTRALLLTRTSLPASRVASVVASARLLLVRITLPSSLPRVRAPADVARLPSVRVTSPLPAFRVRSGLVPSTPLVRLAVVRMMAAPASPSRKPPAVTLERVTARLPSVAVRAASPPALTVASCTVKLLPASRSRSPSVSAWAPVVKARSAPARPVKSPPARSTELSRTVKSPSVAVTLRSPLLASRREPAARLTPAPASTVVSVTAVARLLSVRLTLPCSLSRVSAPADATVLAWDRAISPLPAFRVRSTSRSANGARRRISLTPLPRLAAASRMPCPASPSSKPPAVMPERLTTRLPSAAVSAASPSARTMASSTLRWLPASRSRSPPASTLAPVVNARLAPALPVRLLPASRREDWLTARSPSVAVRFMSPSRAVSEEPADSATPCPAVTVTSPWPSAWLVTRVTLPVSAVRLRS